MIIKKSNRMVFKYAAVLGLCLICSCSAQLTFHSDSNSNSFSLKAPGVQHFFTRNFSSNKNPATSTNSLQATTAPTTYATSSPDASSSTIATAAPLTVASSTPTTYSSLPQLQQQYNQNSARYQQVVQQQAQPQYSAVQYQPYNQRQYAPASPAGGSMPSYAVARPLAQYQQQQYMPAQSAQQQQYSQQPQYPQYQQRVLEQLQQVRPNDVSAYHAAQGQAAQQAAIQAALAQAAANQAAANQAAGTLPQQQSQPQQYVSSYRQYPQYAAQQKEAQAALYGLRQYQQQQQHEQEQQLLAQQEEEEQMQQQNLLHNPTIQKRLLNQLYETFPPPASVTNEEKRNDYTINQYYNFLQNQHEQILNDQQSAMQRYGNSQQQSAGARYSPSTAVSNVRYSGRNSQYTFG